MFINSFIHSIQVLRENSFTAKFLLIKLKGPTIKNIKVNEFVGATTPEKLGPWCCEMKLQMLYKSDLKCDFTTNSHKITKQSYNWSSTIKLTCLQCKCACCANATAITKNATNLKVKVERKNNKWKLYRMEQKFLISASALATWIYIYILCILFLKDWLREL